MERESTVFELNGHEHHSNDFQQMFAVNFTVCEVFKKTTIRSRWIWFGRNPIDYVFPFFMLQLIMSFSISKFLYFVLKPLKQPKLVCNVLAGIIIGPSVWHHNKTMMDTIFRPENLILSNTLCATSGIYFLFITSVKMDKSRVYQTAKRVWSISLVCLGIPMVATATLIHLLHGHLPGNSGAALVFYLNLMASLSHYPVISHAMSDLNLLTSDLGQLAMSVSAVYEIIGLIFTSSLTMLMRGVGKKSVMSQAQTIFFLLSIIFVVRPLMLWIIRKTPEGKPVKGIYVRLILLAPLVTGMLTDLSGATFYPGAQMMGLIIPAGPPLGSAVVEKSEVILSELLLPFFYIRIGQLANVHKMHDWKAAVVLVLFLVISYLGKVVGSLSTMLWFNIDVRNSFLLSLILNIKGIIEFTFFLWWRINGLMDNTQYTTLLLSNVVGTAIVTPLIQIFYKPDIGFSREFHFFENYLRTLQSTPLVGELRVVFCIYCEDNVNGIITLLRAANPTKDSPICAYALHLTQLTGRAMPLLIPYECQRRRLKENATDRIMRAMFKFAKNSTLPVIIQPLRVISLYKSMHESICRLARDKLVSLVIVPFPESLEFHGKTATLRSVNINIQKYASCTVGVLVDRSSIRSLKTTHFSFHVAVIFFGGPDDREALLLALRMSGHPGVSITVIRIDFRDNTKDYNENEKHLDDGLMTEYKTRCINTARLVCQELEAEETVEVLNAIRSLAKFCDLVIVGKKQGPDSRLDSELLPWVEHEELGVIGDMAASSDFCEGRMSVLVMHCAQDHPDGIRSTTGLSDSSLTNSDERSKLSIVSSNCDPDNHQQALVGDQKRDARSCTVV